jgi:hypothetical protein
MLTRTIFAASCATFLLATTPASADQAPVIAIIAHPVADYDIWRAKYDALLPMREAAGLIDGQVFRAPDSPNMIILMHEFETLEGAQALFSSPKLKAAMADAGVTAKPVITLGVAVEE